MIFLLCEFIILVIIMHGKVKTSDAKTTEICHKNINLICSVILVVVQLLLINNYIRA